MTGAKLGFSLALVTACLAAVVLWQLLTPSTELTRFRNALLASPGEAAHFDWHPPDFPSDFRVETLQAPEPFASRVDALALPPTTERAIVALVAHLRSHDKVRGPIKSSTVDAYEQILNEGRGYCADYSQVFNGLAHAAGLTVREWGMSFDGFSGNGHAFNEVYDPASSTWIFVDPMNGFYVRDRWSGRPLSVLDLADRLRSNESASSITVVPIDGAFLFPDAQSALEYYRPGLHQLFLWFGNDVFSYDSRPAVRMLGPLSRPLEQLAAIIAGFHPVIRVVTTEANIDDVRALVEFRRTVLTFCFLLAVGAAAALLFGLRLRSLRKRSAQRRLTGVVP